MWHRPHQPGDLAIALGSGSLQRVDDVVPVLDGTIFEENGRYVMFYKDERQSGEDIRHVVADRPEGSYRDPSNRIVTPAAEGPACTGLVRTCSLLIACRRARPRGHRTGSSRQARLQPSRVQLTTI